MFENILGRKKAFPDYKNNKLKKWKICDFSKGVSPWLWLKIGNFSIFYWNVRGFFDGDSSSSEGTPGLWQSFDTFFLYLLAATQTSTAQLLTTANHPLLTIQLYNLYKHNAGTFRLADHESYESYSEWLLTNFPLLTKVE